MAAEKALEEGHNVKLATRDMQSLARSYRIDWSEKLERYRTLDVTFAMESSIVMRGVSTHKRVVVAKVCGVLVGK